MPLPRNDVLAAIEQANLSPSRSDLSRWMRRNHDAFAVRLGSGKADWVTLARVFEEAGLTDRTGKPASPEAARKAWERTRAAVARTRAKRKVAGQSDLPAILANLPASSGDASGQPGDQPRIRFKPVALKGSSR